MHDRRLTPMDHAVAGLDRLLRTLVPGTVSASEPSPASSVKEPDALDERERTESARLMRVNHSGEVAAQALYQGQAATARLEDIREAMDQAADEENDHLAWCEERLRELDGRTSLLNPIWYAGSFAIGAAAGLVGDRWSLGFVSETERQVCAHLDDHLARLPEVDLRSRRVLTRMKADEQRHGETAERAGGAELPEPVRRLMGTMSKVMTRTAYWI